MIGSHDVLSVLLLVPAGFIIGVLAAAPIGPVNIFVVQRTLSRGLKVGLAAGIGATLADGLLAAIAAFGFTATDDAFANHSDLIQLVGGFVLIVFGLRLVLEPPSHKNLTPHIPHVMDHAGAVPQTFFLAITNPGAILGMFAMVGTLTSAVGGFESLVEPTVLVASVFVACFLWWFGLTHLVNRIHHRLSLQTLTTINRIAGALLVVSGLGLLAWLAAVKMG